MRLLASAALLFVLSSAVFAEGWIPPPPGEDAYDTMRHLYGELLRFKSDPVFLKEHWMAGSRYASFKAMVDGLDKDEKAIMSMTKECNERNVSAAFCMPSDLGQLGSAYYLSAGLESEQTRRWRKKFDVMLEVDSNAALGLEATDEPRKDGAVLSRGVKYEIIQDKPINAGAIRDVVVRVPEPIAEGEIRRIASEVKARGTQAFPKTSIFFLLPGMEVGKGAWARAMYGPELKITIIGATVEETKRLAAAPPPDGKLIGEWIYDLPGMSHRIAFVQRDGKVVMKKTFSDGSSGEYEIVPAGGRKFVRKDEKAGEWMQVNAQGDLEFHTRLGRADTAGKSPSSPPLSAIDEASVGRRPVAVQPPEETVESLRAEIEKLEAEKKEHARLDNRGDVQRLIKQIRDKKTAINRLLREQKEAAVTK